MDDSGRTHKKLGPGWPPGKETAGPEARGGPLVMSESLPESWVQILTLISFVALSPL